MRDLDAWFRRQSGRERRAVYLEEALLGKRFWAYAGYRLRYFFARYAAASAVHATTVVLLSRTFDRADFVAVLVAYAATGLLGSFWWGALEVLRARVRLLYRSGKPHLIPKEIGAWLALSIWLAAAVSAAGIVWTIAHAATGGPPTAADAYVLVLVLRLAAELVTRCYHSGIYAVRRVFRPLPAIVAVEVAGLAGVGLLWPWAGGWAFPAAAAAATALVTVLTFHYTGRLYRFFGFAPSASLRLRRPYLPGRGEIGEFLAAGGSSALMSLDALLVLAVLGTGNGPLGSGTLLLLLFAIGPTIRAGSEWAQLLYFDLKRLEIRLFRNLRRTFDRHVLRLSAAVGVVFWALACLTGTAVVGESLGALYWVLLPFFVSRSLLAAVQMQAFSERAYRQLLANGLLCAAGFAAAGLLLGGGEAVLLGVVAAIALGGSALMQARRHGLDQALRSRDVLWLSEWLAELRGVPGPVRVASVRVFEPPSRSGSAAHEPDGGSRWRCGHLAEQIARRLERPSGVTVFENSLIAWYESGPAPSRVDPEWLMTRSGGLVEWLGETGPQPDGASAVAAARLGCLLGEGLRRGMLPGAGAADPEEARQAFLRTFPSGVVFDPEDAVPELLETLSTADKRLVMLDAVAFARDFRVDGTRSRFDVTSFCVAGELRQIFLVERTGTRRARARWQAELRRLNLESALG